MKIGTIWRLHGNCHSIWLCHLVRFCLSLGLVGGSGSELGWDSLGLFQIGKSLSPTALLPSRWDRHLEYHVELHRLDECLDQLFDRWFYQWSIKGNISKLLYGGYAWRHTPGSWQGLDCSICNFRPGTLNDIDWIDDLCHCTRGAWGCSRWSGTVAVRPCPRTWSCDATSDTKQKKQKESIIAIPLLHGIRKNKLRDCYDSQTFTILYYLMKYACIRNVDHFCLSLRSHNVVLFSVQGWMANRWPGNAQVQKLLPATMTRNCK